MEQTKGKATYLVVDGATSPGAQVAGALSVAVDTAAVVQAIAALTAAVKAVKPEVRIDLPEMSPVIHPSPVPVIVNVPELPANPPVSVTVPDFPKMPDFPPFPDIPSHPVVKLPYVGIFLAFAASNVVAAVVVEVLQTFLHR